MLALFPALIALVSLVGLFGDPQSTTNKLTEIVTSIGPESAANTFTGPIESITSHRGTAGIVLILGPLAALWSASGYVGAFMRASNIIYETPEGRPAWKLRPLQLLVTLALVVLLALVALGLVLTGPIVEAIAEPLGITSTATTIWEIAKWPVLAAIFVLMIDILYYASPNVKLRGFSWVTPRAIVALVVWVVDSAGFAFYVANFGSYDKTYGTLAGVVVLLVWFWITNLAILFGHQLNSERERSLEIQEGRPRAEREIQLERRWSPGPRRRPRWKEARQMKILFLPISIGAGLLAGLLGKKAFERAWSLIDEEEPPQSERRDISWPKLVAALLLEGAIFRLVKGLTDQGARRWFARVTGSWPGEEAPQEE